MIFSGLFCSIHASAMKTYIGYLLNAYFCCIFLTKETKSPTKSRDSVSKHLYLFPYASTAGNVHTSAILPPSMPNSSVEVTSEVTAAVSDVVNEIQRHHDPDPLMALVLLIHLPSPTGCDVLVGNRIKQV